MEIPVVFDGHNDALLAMPGQGRTFFERSEQGHIDLPRAREGQLGGGFCAVFIRSRDASEHARSPAEMARQAEAMFGDESRMPPTPGLEYALQQAIAMTGHLFTIERQSEGQVKVVRTAQELSECLQNGAFAALLHFEGAEAIDPDFESLYTFHRAGLRSLGLVWSRPNDYARGVPFKFPHSPDTGPGLTDAGKALVRECNRLRILVDVSHLNEQGFWDLAELTEAPIVATHSCAWALCHSTRNLTDRQLDAIRESDGMVGVNFNVGFLREDGGRSPDTSMGEIVRHIDYLVERIGIDRVGFGSDFDGALMPADLGDATGLPRLIGLLGDCGYDDAALRKLAHENWVRVLGLTWGE